jgi:hypothetical protein
MKNTHTPTLSQGEGVFVLCLNRIDEKGKKEAVYNHTTGLPILSSTFSMIKTQVSSK